MKLEPIDVINQIALTDDNLSRLSPEVKDLVERRRRVMGPAYRLSYAEPLQPAHAQGAKIIDVQGREFLDAYNNVPSVGHNHPRVIEAVYRQLQKINTNTRYLQRDVVEYAEDFVSTHDAALDNVMFTCTGSEANDLALRIARKVSGNNGVIVTEYAYHGNTSDVSGWSPSAGLANALGADVRLVPAPDRFRMGREGAVQCFVEAVQRQIDDLNRRGIGVAALVVDSLFTSDGVFPEFGALAPAVEAVRRAGGLFICDEVQAGFGRTGTAMWGYQNAGVVPDLVTMGKSMGNGMPIAALVAQNAHLEVFSQNAAYFNTFGGENVPIAAAQAVLDIIRDEHLLENAQRMGEQLVVGMRATLERYELPADVRGAGLYMGVDFVTDLESKMPDADMNKAFVDGLHKRGILVSAIGMYGNVMKVRPPLVFTQDNVDQFLSAFNDLAEEIHNGKSSTSSSLATERPNGDAGVREELRRLIVEELRGLVGQSRG